MFWLPSLSRKKKRQKSTRSDRERIEVIIKERYGKSTRLKNVEVANKDELYGSLKK